MTFVKYFAVALLLKFKGTKTPIAVILIVKF